MKIHVLPVGELGTNCYILADEASKLCAVIDPGDEAERILAQVRAQGLQVKYILLTHGHYDHTTAVPELHAVLPEAEIYIHQADSHGAGGRLFPLASQVDELLLYDEGDTLPLGGLTIEVMNTPGHSLGSVVLRVDDVLFT
ncbi:MAG: MBL fold metallo-hydrolase, partial [Oscillospiraceae bacterium]|nr:MBL fold metallo-hydrolase [Oscillospiraceae bacterium]